MGLTAHHIGKVLGQPPNRILTDISLDIRDGEFIAVTGRSGSGKSTLLYVLSSLDRPSEGSVRIDGDDMADVSEQDLGRFRNQKVGFVFQFHYLLADLNALENVLMPARKTHQEREKQAYAESLLLQFGLGDRLHHYPRQLSGGELQRVAIARALIMKPIYLFADEPTGSLDSQNADRVMEIFRETNKTQRTTILMVTHDPDFARQADRRIHLVDGRVASA